MKKEYEDWGSWFAAKHAEREYFRRKTIPQERRYSDFAWREYFEGAPDKHIRMILHDYPREEFVVYMIPKMSDAKSVGKYDIADIAACDIEDGRIKWFYRLKKVRAGFDNWIFQPEYAAELSYEKNVLYENQLEDEKLNLDEIKIKFWEVDDELELKKLIRLKIVFSEYKNWSMFSSAIYGDREIRYYQPLQEESHHTETSGWLEYRRQISLMTHLIDYVRNEEGEMVLNASPFARKLYHLPQNLGKADVVNLN